MKQKKKKIFFIVFLVLIIVFIFYNFIYKNYINPESSLEAYRSEKGKYLYIINKYEGSTYLKHTLKKVDLEKDSIKWEHKIARKYNHNKQAGLEKSAIFFDENNIYYYVHTKDNYFFILGYDKLTGKNTFDINLNNHIDFRPVQEMLYIPYIDLKDKIIFFNKVNKNEKEKRRFSITAVDKKNFNVLNYKIEINDVSLGYPQGMYDENTDYFTIQGKKYIYVFKKNNISKYKIIRHSSGKVLLKNNYLYYFNNNKSFVRNNLKTGKVELLFDSEEVNYPYFVMYHNNNILIYERENNNNYLRDTYFKYFDFDGNMKWEYKPKKNYTFEYFYSEVNSKFNPAESVFYKTNNNYLPVLLTKKSNKNKSYKRIGIINLKNGKPVWSNYAGKISSGFFLTRDFYQEGNFFYIFYKNRIIQIEKSNGEIIKEIIFKRKNRKRSYNLIERYDLRIHNFVNNFLFLKYKNTVLRINLLNNNYKIFGDSELETEFIIKNSKTIF